MTIKNTILAWTGSTEKTHTCQTDSFAVALQALVGDVELVETGQTTGWTLKANKPESIDCFQVAGHVFYFYGTNGTSLEIRELRGRPF